MVLARPRSAGPVPRAPARRRVAHGCVAEGAGGGTPSTASRRVRRNGTPLLSVRVLPRAAPKTRSKAECAGRGGCRGWRCESDNGADVNFGCVFWSRPRHLPRDSPWGSRGLAGRARLGRDEGGAVREGCRPRDSGPCRSPGAPAGAPEGLADPGCPTRHRRWRGRPTNLSRRRTRPPLRRGRADRDRGNWWGRPWTPRARSCERVSDRRRRPR